ncbi:MAG: nucleotidyltransferase [Elusimicrobia bacterium]|nr:nucleotidyltransferase [Elusimicrobiota bacterium]
MRAEKDFAELLKLLRKNRVKFCIIGAYAVAWHARGRYTKDLDILVEPTLENGKRIIKALKEFGFRDKFLTVDVFLDRKAIIQIGYEPVRVDLLTEIEGVSFDEVWAGRVKGVYGDVEVYYIGLDELIKAKKKSFRKTDEVDLEILKEAKKLKSKRKK